MRNLQRILGVVPTLITRPIYERTEVTPPGTGRMEVCVGYEEVIYRVEVDLDGVASMARKAASNKGGRSNDGPLVVTVERRRRL